jgi:hypothetical protein
MLTRIVRALLPGRRRPLYDRWLLGYRWRHGIRLESAPQVEAQSLADGYRYAWRIKGGVAIGRTLDGELVALPVEVFVARYLAER